MRAEQSPPAGLFTVNPHSEQILLQLMYIVYLNSVVIFMIKYLLLKQVVSKIYYLTVSDL